MSTDHKIALIAITPNGVKLAEKLQKKLASGDLYVSPKLIENKNDSESNSIENQDCPESQTQETAIYSITPSLSVLTEELFKNYDILIFIMATGIVVRTIAPYLKDKFSDPGVLVLDELGQNIISLLSGHMGGANEMTLRVSKLLGANPVITTSTDVNDKAALDNIAKVLDASITDFREAVKEINYSLVQGKKIGLYQEYDYKIDTRGFIILKSLENLIKQEDLDNQGNLVNEECLDNKEDLGKFEKIVCITYKKKLEIETDKIIKVIPKDLVLGIGCRKDTPIELLEKSFDSFLEAYNIDYRAIKCLGSVEVKVHEEAIIALAKKLAVPFKTVTREEIATVDNLFERSEFVKKNIGVYSVAEPAAYLLSGGNLWIGKHKYQGITFAIGRIKA